MTDILLYESGNGGELQLVNGDVATTDAIWNQAYLAHFGGNIEASTTGQEQEGEQRQDWWGNIFFENETDAQMNSSLERTLNDTALTSAGRITIEREAAADLEYFSEQADIEVTAVIEGNDKLQIQEKLNQAQINFTWDATKTEVIEEITI